MTDHKVELDGGPTARVDLMNCFKQLFSAERFVDDITHVLGGSFRCQGKPTMAGIFATGPLNPQKRMRCAGRAEKSPGVFHNIYR